MTTIIRINGSHGCQNVQHHKIAMIAKLPKKGDLVFLLIKIYE